MRSLWCPSITRRRARDRKLSPGLARLAPLFVNVQVQPRRVDCPPWVRGFSSATLHARRRDLAGAEAARNAAAADEIARLTWRAHADGGRGGLVDPDAEAISEALEGRRAAFAARGMANGALCPP